MFTSYVIIAEDKTAIEEEVQRLCSEKNISSFDTTVFDLSTTESKTTPKKSWGIDDSRAILKKINLKPFQGDWKAVVIHDADTMTSEAQNALLKTLEEPPAGTLILLTASRSEVFLPTVLSRCRVLVIGERQILSPEEYEKYHEELMHLLGESVGERLKKAEVMSKNKEEVLSFIRNCLLALHSRLPSDPSDTTLSLLKVLHTHYVVIKGSNTNLRLATEHLLLSFPKQTGHAQ